MVSSLLASLLAFSAPLCKDCDVRLIIPTQRIFRRRDAANMRPSLHKLVQSTIVGIAKAFHGVVHSSIISPHSPCSIFVDRRLPVAVASQTCTVPRVLTPTSIEGLVYSGMLF